MSRLSGGSKKCAEKEILRSSYSRKGYTRKDGTKVHGSHVSQACVPAKGKALSRGSKTPKREKVLPKLDEERSLAVFGYGTHKNANARHAALEAASKKWGSLAVLRRLNLIRNYQADPAAKKVMSADVEFMSKLHSKRKSRGSKGSKGSKKSRGSRKGSRKSSRGGSRKGSRKGSKRGSCKGSRKSRKGSRRSK